MLRHAMFQAMLRRDPSTWYFPALLWLWNTYSEMVNRIDYLIDHPRCLLKWEFPWSRFRDPS